MISAGQGKPRLLDTSRAGLDEGGYLMVVLLIGMAVTAVWMGSLLPSWRQQAVREKEAELVFRGEQYARAIAIYYRKNQRLPPNVDTLVSQRYLRKKYVDPITEDEFLTLGGLTPGTSLQQQPPQAQGRGPGGASPPRGAGPARGAAPAQGAGQTQSGGFTGISGVRSTSTDTSIVVYRNQQSYSQFPFDYQLALQRMGVQQGGGQNDGRAGSGAGPARPRGGEFAPIGPGGPRNGGGPGPARPGAGGGVGPRGGAGGPPTQAGRGR